MVTQQEKKLGQIKWNDTEELVAVLNRKASKELSSALQLYDEVICNDNKEKSAEGLR